MKLEIDEETYVLGDDTINFMISSLRLHTLEMYAKMNEKFKFPLKALSRQVLYNLENKYGNELLNYPLRPKKGEDPVIHMYDLSMHILRLASEHVTIQAKSENTPSGARTLTYLAITDQD